MSTEEVLRLNEQSAARNERIISRVSGKKLSKQGVGGTKAKTLGAAGFITAIIVVFLVFFSTGNLMPTTIMSRLVEETDVQYADAVESKILVLQQALFNGNLPENTVMRLRDNGVVAGHIEDGAFMEGGGENAAVKMGDKVILATDFVTAVHTDTKLYAAVNNATYSRAAGYYDAAAEAVFKEIGTSRDNFTADADFEAVMTKIMGGGSNIDINSVVAVETMGDDGEIRREYTENGGDAKSTGVAADFIEKVRQKYYAENTEKATLDAADALNVADTIAKEQKSSLFFLAMMENISKMKAGDGNESKINEMMNYMFRETESQVVDVRTGEIVTTKGSMLESPSLYAVLAGEGIDPGKVQNYSSDRILQTTENALGISEASANTLLGTITSTSTKLRGAIGRFLESTEAEASSNELSKVEQTVNSSLINNSFESMGGIAAGEELVDGAVNVGKALARASGATAGDAAAVKSYARTTETILALDAEVDRANRSPFDITSRNTFLGAIVYKMGVGMMQKGNVLNGMTSIMKAVAGAITGAQPKIYAEDGEAGYLTSFGDCETLGAVGAVGSATCAEVATFDTSTLNDPFGDAKFVEFVEENTTLENGVRRIKQDSKLASFIVNNDERKTPVGVMDGGILESTSGASKIPFISDILSIVKKFLGASEEERRLASGATFVNSSTNPDWGYYKYAQRYVALARATDMLRQYDGDEMAYSSMKFFEGKMNPVVAFLNEYHERLAAK